MDFDKEMQKALEADGEKLRALTGEDHGPVFLSDRMDIICPFCGSPFVECAPELCPEMKP